MVIKANSTTMTAKLSSSELRAATSLASVMALRMFGLFMVLPLFSLYAHQLQGATPFLIGLAVGIYGLTQCIFQIPFGLLSDQIGRKKIITFGLVLFACGSILAAFSQTIFWMILGRALQGMGAVGSAIMAMIADLTRPAQRSKAMAIVGITIGLSFSLAMMLGPLLASWLSLRGLFLLAAFFSFIGILVLVSWTPSPAHSSWHEDTEPEWRHFLTLLKNPELFRLNAGIFILHAIFTANFVIIPISLQNLAGLHGNQQWLLYLPILLLAFLFSLIFITDAEKRKKVKFYFVASIATLTLSELFLWLFAKNLLLSAVSLLLFFSAFSLLEAFLPSLVSQTAPPHRKGTALGIYSCSQFLGIFVGGAIGGWLYGSFGLTDVYLFCVILGFLWLTLAWHEKAQYSR